LALLLVLRRWTTTAMTDDVVEETERLAIAKARYLARYAAIRREQKKR
jgi:hypothetical protein